MECDNGNDGGDGDGDACTGSCLRLPPPPPSLGHPFAVTGGGSGIGKAIAWELAHLGCTVVIASRTLDKLTAAAADLRADLRTDRVAAKQCNIRVEAEVRRWVVV